MLPFFGFAQPITGYFFQRAPQSVEYNPALRRDSSRFFIAMPGISKIDLDLGTSGYTLGDIVNYGEGNYADSLVFDMDRFYNSLSAKNSITQELAYTWFNFGFKAGKSFITLGITEKEYMNPYFSKELVGLFKDGNANYIGQNYQIGNSGFDALYYTEAALTFTREISKKLSFGVTAKALIGRAAIVTEDFDFSVNTPENLSYMDIKLKSQARVSFPGNLEKDEDNYVSGMNMEGVDPFETLTNTDNMGWAFGFGTTYKPIKGLEVAASVMDLGSIQWKTNSYKFTQHGSYRYEGTDFSDVFEENVKNGEDQNDFEEIIDSIGNSFRVSDTEEGFTSSIPTKIYLSGSYQLLGSALEVGTVYRKRIWDSGSDDLFSFSANALLLKFLSLSASYTMLSDSYNNMGLGVGLRGGPLQFYVMSDNILPIQDYTTTRGTNFRFGINWLLGRN